MAYSERELVLLNCFMYSNLASNSKKDATLGQVIGSFVDKKTGKVSLELIQQAIDSRSLELSGDMKGFLKDTPERVQEVFQDIYSDEKLSRLIIKKTTDEYYGSIRAACFYDSAEDDVAVVFRGTGGSFSQWSNNFDALGDLSQQTQRDALDFINSLPYDNITVSGHSNGGNEAMFVTYMCGDKISRCVSFEGQGFSLKFRNTYRDEIKANKSKVKNICGDNEIVDGIFSRKLDNNLYIPTTGMHGIFGLYATAKKYESEYGTDAVYDENGNFREEYYKEPGTVVKVVRYFTNYLDILSEVPLVGAPVEFFSDFLRSAFGTIMGYEGIVSELINQKHFNLENLLEIYKGQYHNLVGMMINLKKNLTKDSQEIFDNNFRLFEKIFASPITAGANKIKSLRYVGNNPIIKVDTEKLKEYASRLRKINARLEQADSNIGALYSRTNLLDILDLIHADLLTGPSRVIKHCAEYAEITAFEFEQAERAITSKL